MSQKPQLAKPVDRFSQARDFAIETKPTESINENCSRENFDCPNPLRKEIKIFLANSNLFKTKREFILQCIRDGLEKYKGK